MAIESRDPSNDDSLLGTFNVVLRKYLQSCDDMLPAQVEVYDRARNIARVRPFIQLIDTDGNFHTRAPYSDIPVLILGGGNFLISYNLPVGSRGWIKASDRDLSIFRQSFRQAPPNTVRMHKFEDALFIPDVMTGYTIAADDATAMVIQNTGGSVKISLSDTRININAPAVNINATGAIALTSTSLTHNGTNIGDDHTHSQGADSRGDAEQDTGGPQ